MLGLILINYLLALGMNEDAPTARRKLFLILSLICNLGAIGFFKYADFVLSSIRSVTGWAVPSTGVSLPIGISFFTY